MNNIVIFNITDTIDFLPEVKSAVLDFCQQYPINFKKQNYKISINNESINKETSKKWYKVTEYKYLHFFGRVYLDNDVEETIVVNNTAYSFTATKNTVLLVLNGLKINSSADNANVINFYIASEQNIINFEPSAWHVL